MLADSQIKQFYSEGYTIVRDVIPQTKLPEYREAYERMVEKVRAHPGREKYNTRLIQGNDKVCWGCDFLLHPDLYEPAFTDYLNNRKLLTSLGSILGDDLRISGLKAIWSPVRANYDLGWHRDGPKDIYSEDGTQAYIQFNTALYHDESFRLVPGSHLRPLTEEEDTKYRSVEDITNQLVCMLEPGDAMFMHAAVLHRGKASSSTKRRTLHYIIASSDYEVGTKRLNQFKGWYDEMRLDEKLEPAAKKLFDNFFAWQGKTFDDHYYPGLNYKN
ncbi:phytanoyl-CoA dioxygenase family protein [Paenibacillus sepulcri]|uniref:Phytanoyl-CoA dioxygenase family protein n=1 Tax=Paenibacillus sepulcri TaxID=359917 RepID=A0ABS7C1L8_9BACL|nr:phytanoyl-CoA dioxygenase family protein [Paenibacillus sepulcri]